MVVGLGEVGLGEFIRMWVWMDFVVEGLGKFLWLWVEVLRMCVRVDFCGYGFG